jgi:putative MFS transporter
MNQTVNANRLFLASCFALITTSMAFGIRAGVLTQLGQDFQLDNEQLGYVNQMAFLGFPIAMIIGGPLYNVLGPKKIIWVAFFTHVIGLILTIFAGGFWSLLLSTFFVGFGNGTVEAACNPMISDMFEGKDKTKMLNRFHMWFPGGIVIATLLSQYMTGANLGWQLQIAAILVPAVIYAYLFYGQTFPEAKVEGGASTGENFKAMLSPLYLFMLACMALTAISEFGPEQWIGPIMSTSGASPMIILAIVTGLMAVGRYFAGPIVHKLDAAGVLLTSAILTAIGVYLMSNVNGYIPFVLQSGEIVKLQVIYLWAIIFALGVCYFWPTMIGYVAENIPRSGAFGLSIMGGMGMFATSIFQPIIGSWLDSNTAEAAKSHTGDAIALAAGQATMGQMVLFPAILIVAFAGLYFFGNKAKQA